MPPRVLDERILQGILFYFIEFTIVFQAPFFLNFNLICFHFFGLEGNRYLNKMVFSCLNIDIHRQLVSLRYLRCLPGAARYDTRHLVELLICRVAAGGLQGYHMVPKMALFTHLNSERVRKQQCSLFGLCLY